MEEAAGSKYCPAVSLLLHKNIRGAAPEMACASCNVGPRVGCFRPCVARPAASLRSSPLAQRTRQSQGPVLLHSARRSSSKGLGSRNSNLACAAGEDVEKPDSFLSKAEAGIIDFADLEQHEKFLVRLTVWPLQLVQTLESSFGDHCGR